MKLLFGFIIGIAIFTIVVALYCALIIAGRCDRSRKSAADINKNFDESFLKEQICSNCNFGKRSYELDRHSESCPYMVCWENGKCHFYTPLDNSSNPELISKTSSDTKNINRKSESNC